jgi:cation diffusion facilitator CzcD-associated flavoprotein CzcO
VRTADWDTDSATWTVLSSTPDAQVRHTCSFLYLATGYYRYDRGHVVDFGGRDEFAGTVVHPQHWPEGLDVAGRQVVVIGSGATAVTLVPALADQGATHVTMLQRSPTFMVSLPGRDRIAATIGRHLPAGAAYRVIRAKNLALNVATYQLARRFPEASRRLLTWGVARSLPAGYDVGTHFTPRYDPWDERLCVVPDGDLFATVAAGRAEIVTDTLDRFTATGVRLTSGRELPADVVVTATGLSLQVVGGIDLTVDGSPVTVNEEYVYKGLMLSGVPNLAWCVGYTNNSWTLRADLTATYVCRLLAFLDERGLTTATPRFDGVRGGTRPLLDLTAGYVQRATAILPKQGERPPWRLRQNYVADLLQMRTGRVDDGCLELTRAPGRAVAEELLARR